MSLASRYFVSPSGVKNSSFNISPGDAEGTVRMLQTPSVVFDDLHDLDVLRAFGGPDVGRSRVTKRVTLAAKCDKGRRLGSVMA